MTNELNSLCLSCKNPCKQYAFALVIECPSYSYNNKRIYKNDTYPIKELSNKEKREIKELVQQCANYCDYYNVCLPLDTCCYMLNKGLVSSGVCKYFARAVLPLNPRLEQVLTHKTVNSNKSCTICGALFEAQGRKKYCSDKCQNKGKKEADKLRARKYRNSKR